LVEQVRTFLPEEQRRYDLTLRYRYGDYYWLESHPKLLAVGEFLGR
jgi:hypothetical protein